MLFLARKARRLSWTETGEAFRTSWDKPFDAVEHLARFGLKRRNLGQFDAIGGLFGNECAPTEALNLLTHFAIIEYV